MDLAAALDVGSNTLRLLIARVQNGRLRPVLLDREVTRLSQHLTPGGRLDPAAQERALRTLARFAGRIKKEGVSRVFGGATAWARLAADGGRFLERVRAETGLDLSLLSGREEARLTALGVLSGLKETPDRALVVDPGGQSSEFTLLEAGRPGEGLSLDLGVVSLLERHLRRDPPLAMEMAGLKAEVVRRLGEVKAAFAPAPELRLVGTAGTVTTIAAMILELRDYDPARVTGARLKLEQVAGLLDRLLAMPAARRLDLPGLEPGREDVIVPGLVLVQSLLEEYSQNEMLVVDAGLLEGLILAGLQEAGLNEAGGA